MPPAARLALEKQLGQRNLLLSARILAKSSSRRCRKFPPVSTLPSNGFPMDSQHRIAIATERYRQPSSGRDEAATAAAAPGGIAATPRSFGYRNWKRIIIRDSVQCWNWIGCSISWRIKSLKLLKIQFFKCKLINCNRHKRKRYIIRKYRQLDKPSAISSGHRLHKYQLRADYMVLFFHSGKLPQRSTRSPHQDGPLPA